MAKSLVGPSAASSITWSELNKRLLVVEPLAVEKGVKTRYTKPGEEPGDAVRANVYAILKADGSEFESYEDILIFPKWLQGQVRKEAGKGLVVGRLYQGEARKGEDPPWMLADPNEKDLAAAAAWHSSFTMSAAAAPSRDGEDGFDDVPDGDDGEGEF